MSATASSLRCRLGLHRWQTHRIADGLVVSTCPSCGREEGPFPAHEDPGPRMDPHDVFPGGN